MFVCLNSFVMYVVSAFVREYGPGLCCGFSLWMWRDLWGGFLGEDWEGVVV